MNENQAISCNNHYNADGIVENSAALDTPSEISDVVVVGEDVNNHTDAALLPNPSPDSSTKRCGNLNLSAFNLSQEEENALAEMMASSAGDGNVSSFI